MAFQSSVYRNGQWVTETVNLNDALKASAAHNSKGVKPQADLPKCGLVSRTIVESPVVHWALSVRLRSKDHNDIVFVGDHFVQVCELQPDGQTHEVARKDDFGARIRHAVVFGHSHPEDVANDCSGFLETDDADILMEDSAPLHANYRSHCLPPQMLVVILETGDTLFLFVRERLDGVWETAAIKQKRPNNLKYLGFHLAIDPSSRYMVAGSAQGAFMLYELESLEQLNIQYRQRGSFDPIRAVRARAITGIVCQLAFLHPQPTLDDHVILLLVLCQGPDAQGRIVTRMVTCEWRHGDDLRRGLTETTGIRLPDDQRLPLTLIPLTCQSAFLTVTKEEIILVKDLLSGSPKYEGLPIRVPSSTPLFHGAREPLWTGWTRPPRLEKYLERTDIIYVGREDGVIVHVEIEAKDLLTSATYVGSLDTNITTAFTAAFDIFSDVLIITGDSGPGGIWKLPARGDLEHVGSIYNWSPVVDFATTRKNQPWMSDASMVQSTVQSRTVRDLSYRQDRVFLASGRGVKSAVTELRWGIQARIGLDIDCEQPVRQSWMFPVETQEQSGFHVLLSLPDSSDVLQFSKDLAELKAVPPESAPFDVTSRTVYASKNAEGIIIQVTEKTTTLVAPSQSSRHPHDQTSGLGHFVAHSASCLGDVVAVYGHDGQAHMLLVLRVDQMNVSHISVWDIEPSTTCISLFSVLDNTFIAAGSRNGKLLVITIYSLEGRTVASRDIGPAAASSDAQSQLESFTSICVFESANGNVNLVCGTRSGHLVTARITESSPEQLDYRVEQLGMAPSYVFSASGLFYGKPAVFACCYHNTLIMTNFSPRNLMFKTKTSIWPTDAKDPSMPSPPVNSIFCLDSCLSGHSNHMSVMLLAGSRMLLADIWPHVGAVPRSIPLEGNPMRIIYSQTWECLIVAHAGDKGYPVISFIDPDTGASIGMATDKEGRPIDTISGLDHEDDRVLGLYEWRFVKDGGEFPYLIVTTISGRYMIVSVMGLDTTVHEKRFKYWTRYKKKADDGPICSVAGDADGIVYCSGSTLHWEVLDVANKKFREVKEYRLESPATSLRLAGGQVWALTNSHSLQILDLHAESDQAMVSVAHSDQVARHTTHLVDMADSTQSPGQWPINIFSTEGGGLAGVWVPWGRRDKELVLLFEGRLNTAVRRFRKGHTRPLWVGSGREKKYNSLSSTPDGAEVLGVSLDGTMMHFALIGPDLWAFLRLILNLARFSSTIFPFTHIEEGDNLELDLEPDRNIRSLHIDGNVLQRCLDHRVLEDLANIGNGDGFDLIREYLDGIDGGVYTTGFEEDADRTERYIELAYDILEYVLAPVL